MKNCLIPFFGTALLLMACGDEVTNISEYGGADTVKAFKDLGKCDKSAIGKFVYVSDSVKVYACTDDGWAAVTGTAVSGKNGSNGTNGKNGKDGADGKDGTDGKSCTMTAFKDGTGFDVICDGKSIGSVKNGADGADGKDGSNGKNGTSCSVAKAEDSDDAVVTCGKTSVTIHNGVDGKPGAPGTKGTDGTNGTNGTNGSDLFKSSAAKAKMRQRQSFTRPYAEQSLMTLKKVSARQRGKRIHFAMAKNMTQRRMNALMANL